MTLSNGKLAATKVLIAGMGSIGQRHFRNLQALGVSQFVFYRTHQATRSEPELKQWPATSDLNEALAHKPTVAIVANPTALHMDVALAAAQAGCHLFIEKPLSHSLEHCQALGDVVAKKNLTAMIGCQFRFHPLLVSLRRQLQEGRLGEVIGVRAEWGEYLPDWHPWEDHRRGYSARRDLGGGVVLTLIHPLDYLYWMFGAVEDVQSTIRGVPSLQTDAQEDWADISLRFSSGVVAQVHLDYLQKPPVHRLSAWGDRGRAIWDYYAGTLAWQAPSGEEIIECTPADFERNTMFVDEMRHFLEAVGNRTASAIPLEDGITVLDIALRAKQCGKRETCHG